MSMPSHVSRIAVAFALEAKAAAIERMRAPDQLQPHSRLLPTEIEQAEARYAAQQLRVVAGEIREGLEG